MRRSPLVARVVLVGVHLGPFLVFGLLLLYTALFGDRVTATVTECESTRGNARSYSCDGTWTVDGVADEGWLIGADLGPRPLPGMSIEVIVGPIGAFGSVWALAFAALLPTLAAVGVGWAVRRMLAHRRAGIAAAEAVAAAAHDGDLLVRCGRRSIATLDGTVLYRLSGERRRVVLRRESDGAEWTITGRDLGGERREVRVENTDGTVVGGLRTSAARSVVSITGPDGMDLATGTVQRDDGVWTVSVVDLDDARIAYGVRVMTSHVVRIAPGGEGLRMLLMLFPILAAWTRRSMMDFK